jgi:hypothetical protein
MADEVKVAQPTKLSTAKEIWLAIYSWGKKIVLQVFGGLLMDPKDGIWIVSMTKTATWVLLAHSLYVWNQVNEASGITTRQDIGQGELYILMSLLGVTGVKIGAKAVNDVFAKIQAGPSAEGGE